MLRVMFCLLLLCLLLCACSPGAPGPTPIGSGAATLPPGAGSGLEETASATLTRALASAAPSIKTATPQISTPQHSTPLPEEGVGPDCEPPAVQELALDTPLLARPLLGSVYLPPCYETEPERRYPVLYLIHGQTYDQTQWQRLGAPAAAERLIRAGELPPFVMVLPYDPDWRQPTEDPFGRALVEVLLPAVDAAYRTLPEPRYRAVGGLSRGAAWAVHLGLTHPDLFGAIGAHSLPLFWTDEPRLPAWLDAVPAGQMPRIAIDIGRADQQTLSAQEFADLLDERGIPHTWRLNPGAHDEAYWSAHVEEYLRFYAADWAEE